MNDILLTPLISPHDMEQPIKWKQPLDVEIGSGNGEMLIYSAKQFPKRNFVGIDQSWPCIYKTLREIKKNKGLQNIRILQLDARSTFERLFQPNSIDKITSLFPCPWPKKSHIKNRLFSGDFLKLLNNRLKEQGNLTITTDYFPYREWILKQSRDIGLSVQTKTIQPRYNTKFERKWQKEGQENFYEISLNKQKFRGQGADFSLSPLSKENLPLKSYKLDNFQPNKLQFKDHAGDITVIFKDMLFDSSKQKAMVQVLVSEQELTQYVWITIRKNSDGWQLFKTNGQKIFPTPGIALALKLVYEAAGGE